MKLFAMFMFILQSQGERCLVGWFGPQCEFECHCKSNKCTDSGECTVNTACQTGWFGPQCQYIDLTSNKSSTNYSWLNDGDDETCNDGNLTRGGLSITTDVEFTWARIVVKDPKYLYDITVQFQDNTTCMDMKSFTVNDRIQDVVCLNYTTVTSVILKGKGVDSLCSFYISGGRNVALKQYANMTSTLSIYGVKKSAASNAVDGDRGQNFEINRCAHSTVNDPKPKLMIFFGNYVQINRVVIYNRADPRSHYVINRTLGFILNLLDGGDILVQYRDKTGKGQTIYNIRFREKIPVQAISIEATNMMRGGKFINICEVEVYGETLCPIGKHGIRCEESCDQCKQNDCFVSTGDCLNGCVPGKVPTDCFRNCYSGRYGQDCSNECPQTCSEQKCEPVLGACTRGCVDGYVGEHCESGCENGFYGPNCTLKCPGKCLNGTCLPHNGKCAVGCQEDYEAPACINKKSEDLKFLIQQDIVRNVLIAMSIAVVLSVFIYCCRIKASQDNEEMSAASL